MNQGIQPYQWELLTSMIAYKLSDGLNADNSRITTKEQGKIAEDLSVTKDLIRKWLGFDRPPPYAYLDRIVKYTSDVFPYKSWQQFDSKEKDEGLYLKCQNWDIYKKKIKCAPKDSKPGEILLEIKNWVVTRLKKLAPKLDLRPDIFFVGSQNAAKDFDGQYVFFMPGQIPPHQFQPVYINNITIYDGGKVKFENPQTTQVYYGEAVIRDASVLQIILYRAGETLGFEWVFSIQLNRYSSKATHYPGLGLSFSGQGEIISYPILISAKTTLHAGDKLVTRYFKLCNEKLTGKGRMFCLPPAKLLEINQQGPTRRKNRR